MNPYNQDLARARRGQQLFLLSAFVLGLLIVCVVVAVIYAGNGTRVQILPIDAAESGKVQILNGMAVTFDKVIYGLGGDTTVAVSADGFRTEQYLINKALQGRTVAITLQEIPATLVLATNPARQETRWSIDGGEPKISDSLSADLPSGKHRIDVNNPYFQPEVLELELKRAEIRDVTVPLRPVKGKFGITTKPSGAEVSIAGKKVGISPVEIDLPGGSHSVSVTKEGFLEIVENIEIKNDRPSISRNYILQRQSATMAFSVVHKDGILLLNGREVSPSKSRKVPANQAHNVTYALPGFITETKIVTLKPGETRLLRFKLTPDLGLVDIQVRPGGDIFIDGKRAARDTVRLKLPSRPHELIVLKEGYRAVKRRLQPSSARTTTLDIVMETELAARLREVPETYTNSAGIRLTRFNPSSIIMGAPRHEQGQRANEILREVYLKKIFYASLYEVTVAQFGKFRGGGTSNNPVVSVSWLDAATFCNWLSLKEGLTPFYSIKNKKLIGMTPTADGYRLLTEAEWEWLARRAGKKEQTMFTWGDKSIVPSGAGNIADENANGIARYYVPNYNDGHVRIAPVGSFPPEPSGLFDMTGNVREWVHDAYSIEFPVGNKVVIDPVNSAAGGVHTVKGSSWKSGTRTALRAAYREGVAGANDDIGFRLGRYLYGKTDIANK